MAKSITIVVPDALAAEILAFKTGAEVKELLKKVLADLVREARQKAAEAAKPVVSPVDDSGVSVTIA